MSNKDSRYRLKYGETFKDMLNARDHVMEHEFTLTFDLTDPTWLKDCGKDLHNNQLYITLKKNIKEFLA